MKTNTEKLELSNIDYPLSRLYTPEQILFLDIETTGFTAQNSYLYLIGCVSYENNSYILRQWFAEGPFEERSILRAFLAFAENFHFLVHFNGDRFDLPYLIQKCEQHELPVPFKGMDGADLYKRLAPLKELFRLPNTKQKTLEIFMRITRRDEMNGGELIKIYEEYVEQHDNVKLALLLLHNADDIRGMLKLLPALAYADLLSDGVRVVKVNANYYQDYNQKEQAEIVMKLAIPLPLPIPVSARLNGCFFTANGCEASIKVPLVNGEMKYFYANYKDYYYLPAEDTALHKSVASFVDKEHRVPATAATCYTRKESTYLPEWEPLFLPIFKSDYNSPEIYFELTDEFKKDREAFARYASHILRHMMLKK